MTSANTLFILVSYYNDDEVIRFINHLSELKPGNYQILIINNGARSHERLKNFCNERKETILLDSEINTGYLGAAAFGLKNHLSRFPLPDFVILCNSDIKLSGSAEAFFQKHANSGFDVIGPSITDASSRQEMNPYMVQRISKAKLLFLIFIFNFYPFYIIYQLLAILKSRLKPKANLKEVKSAYAIHGCFMIFKRSFFERGGSLEYPCLLYGEEIQIAEIARSFNMRIAADPDLMIIHDAHSTTGIFKTLKHVRLMKGSLQYLVKTYFSK